jgi:hypothetical protein
LKRFEKKINFLGKRLLKKKTKSFNLLDKKFKKFLSAKKEKKRILKIIGNRGDNKLSAR